MGCGASSEKIIDPLHVNITHFTIERVIGQGGFGKVNACIHKPTGKWYAIKTLEKQTVIKTQNADMIMNERNLLVLVNNPFIVNMFYSFQDEDNCYMVMDLCLGGDLRYQLNHSSTKHFTEEQAKFYIACLLMALEYLHSKKIIHRDIKPDNMLLDANGYTRLTDFGISQQLDEEGNCYAGSGTRAYMAAEILRSKHKHKHNRISEFYSIGVVTYEFLSGKWPYTLNGPSGSTTQQNLDPVEAVKKIAGVSSEAEDFLVKTLEPDYHKRLGCKNGVKELIDHEWFKDIDWDNFRRKDEKLSPFKPDTNKANCDTGPNDLVDTFPDERVKPKLLPEQQELFAKYNFNTNVKVDSDGQPVYDENETAGDNIDDETKNEIIHHHKHHRN